jgi:hypothetical protein
MLPIRRPWWLGKGYLVAGLEYLKPYPCPSNSTRTCGVEGQVIDMIQNGADPDYMYICTSCSPVQKLPIRTCIVVSSILGVLSGRYN